MKFVISVLFENNIDTLIYKNHFDAQKEFIKRVGKNKAVILYNQDLHKLETY